MPVLAAVSYAVLAPQPGHAIPAFARKYNVKCYNCHTIPPALNKTGYMFKRLGYRMLPDDMDGTKPAPKIAELDSGIKFNLTDALALVTIGSFSTDKTGGSATSSTSSFNLDEAALFASGSVPQSNFSYFTQYELYQGGSSFLEQAFAVYTGGRANSSFFGKAGQMHLQEGEGTRAAFFYNLFPDPPLILTNSSPINFSLDQHPVGIDAGYTWASNYFKHIFAVSAKVTNGLNADGSEIIFNSQKNRKDFWLDADYWYGADSGVTFMMYSGNKDQVQNQGTPDEFTFRPTIRRYGVFGNYMIADKVDLLGGYVRSNDDWQDLASSGLTNITSNGYRGEVDYYVKQGWAIMARYDRLGQRLAGSPAGSTWVWGVGSEKALTQLGNVIIRGTYNFSHFTDPVAGSVLTDKMFKIDLRMMW
jgi:hypothetical protein